ncbi:hypothetical protein CSV80_06825 [Sporosarcina sp. P12(2017)]|uniref:hypothetical protein n=1 Tax=unclassified Sporosarcina TaxID=2647733 RepID=UPI000C16B5E5|nr:MULTISPECIES: hypothetical protein [unclassified Sporosarcina]PIC58010.1 hypothetical protein CSV81_06970 [Sporosarcina sp. P10]PIC61393.1 hypothetical protein CSV80_06825 [Sporosarcina sp. P12(2017)]
MFSINSYISNDLPHLGYMTSKKEQFLSIHDPLALKAAQLIIDNNDGDYLEGCITATYNFEVIFTQDFETTDLLFTWQTIIAPLLIGDIDEHFTIVFLDSLITVDVSEKDTMFNLRLEDPKHMLNYDVNKVTNIPKEEYLNGITTGFLSFVSFCFHNELKFCGESSYPSFMLDYQTVKSKIDLN